MELFYLHAVLQFECVVYCQASSYGERAKALIAEVKEIFNTISMADGESINPLNDLLQRLSIVDNVQRLGIERHFQNEIRAALQYVYRSVLIIGLKLLIMFWRGLIHIKTINYLASSFWSEKGIGCGRDSVDTDLNTTALGFRILRLHGYTVFPGIQLLLICPSFNLFIDRSQLASACRYW